MPSFNWWIKRGSVFLFLLGTAFPTHAAFLTVFADIDQDRETSHQLEDGLLLERPQPDALEVSRVRSSCAVFESLMESIEELGLDRLDVFSHAEDQEYARAFQGLDDDGESPQALGPETVHVVEEEEQGAAACQGR